MKNRFLLTTCLVMASLLSFATANAKDLRLAYDADPVTLDIHEQLSGGMLQLSHMSFDPLIRWTKDLAFENRLATSYERLNPTTVRFNLRKGVKFHSGNPMTAADFKWTFDRLKVSPDFKGPRPTFSRWTASSTPAPMPTATTRAQSSKTGLHLPPPTCRAPVRSRSSRANRV
jgi:ABC-type transport system substrate-binding protein